MANFGARSAALVKSLIAAKGKLYFIAGLAIQRGFPVLFAPVIIAIYGANTYAEFIALMAASLLIATAGSLGLPQSLVPLWYRQEHPEKLAAGVLLALAVAMVSLIFPLTGLALNFGSTLYPDLETSVLVASAILLPFLYNINLTATSIARAQGLQKLYAISMLVGAILFAAIVLIVAGSKYATLPVLLFAQMISFLVPSLILIPGRVLHYAVRPAAHGVTREDVVQLAKTSLPIFGHSTMVVLAQSVDKIVLKTALTSADFSAYVIDYQMAFASLIAPTVVNFVAGPMQAEAAARGDTKASDRLSLVARLASFLGSLGTTLAIYIYASLANVPLTYGFWVIAAAFHLHGMYMQVSSEIMGSIRFKSLFWVTVFALSFYLTALFVAVYSASLSLAYMAWFAYSAPALLLALWQARRIRVLTVDEEAAG